MDEAQQLTTEIERLHQFFEDWYAGVGDRSMGEFADSLDEAFYIVSPRGDVMDKAGIVGMVHNLGETGDVEIRIRNVELRSRLASGIRIVTYEEHERRPSDTVAMISTVGLLPDAERPGGFAWSFVHETFLRPISAGRPADS
jgi:hypothetical protein